MGGLSRKRPARLELQSAQKHPLVFRSADSALAWAGVVALIVVAAGIAYQWSERNGYANLSNVAVHQLELYAAGLDSELGKYEGLPGILEQDDDVLALLQTPIHAHLREKVNRRLGVLNVRAGSMAILVLNPQGTVLASSNWYEPQSSVGKDLSAAPYFEETLQTGQARSFVASATRGAPECYLTQAIQHQGRTIGLTAVKVSLESIESTWIESTAGSQSANLLVVDDNDVVIMSSAGKWKYKTTTTPSASRRAKLAGLGKYPKMVEPLEMVPQRQLEHGTQLVRLPSFNAGDPQGLYVAQDRVMARSGWRLITLSDAAPVRIDARNTAFAAGTLAGLVGVLIMYLMQRRREIGNRLAAREALQRAHDELEQRVRERTAELSQANAALVGEVAERRRTEEVLRDAQEELVQAGKLALLGQISAGITHEISQPLTALRALSDNARQQLKRGSVVDVARNLDSIAALTDRMGRITAQLKPFARKTQPVGSSVVLVNAVMNAFGLLRSRIDSEGVEAHVDVPDSLRVLCDGYQLEQVLVNLIANGLDAMKGTSPKRLTVSSKAVDSHVQVRITDSGPGIPDAVMPRLFEPFFSTKPAGEGLGLGLVISSSIVREFGGTLRAMNVPGGAVFEFDLRLEKEASHA